MSVPATAVYNGGIACTPDGAVYVQHTDGATMANPTFTEAVTLPGSGSITATEWLIPSDVRLTRQTGFGGVLVSSNNTWIFLSDVTMRGAGSGNGQGIGHKSLSELTTIAAAATTDTTIQMPANSIVLAVSVRVTTAIPTAATFTVGDSVSPARFSTAAVSTAADTTDVGTKAGAYYNASALAIRITPNLTPADNTGRVRVTIHYLEVTPPTS